MHSHQSYKFIYALALLSCSLPIQLYRTMRQTKLSEYSNGARPPRITRGNSDLPKDEPKPVESESESSEEQSSNNPPKQKKIHHMTLKALERKKKMEEQAAALGISLEPKSEVPKIPKKRGRPKGYRVKKVEERDDFQVKESANHEKQATPQKKQFALRKRDHNKRFVDEDSEALQRDLQEMEEKSQNLVKQPEVEQMKPQLPKPEVVAPSAPKKRGRKKKVTVQAAISHQPVQPPAQKLFTVPKIQTYENYNKYYDKLMEVRNEDIEQQPPLIFNKFQDPEGYEKLLQIIK